MNVPAIVGLGHIHLLEERISGTTPLLRALSRTLIIAYASERERERERLEGKLCPPPRNVH